jgi:tRNA(fMet)-specific endonuclease VapC
VKRVLLDTNAYVRYLQGDQDVLHILSSAESVYLSIFVIGELLTGFKGGAKGARNRNLLEEFFRKSTVKILSATMDTAEFFSTIKNDLRRKGAPIPINDVWIAAHTMETGSMLITFDTHFREVSGLLVCNIHTADT